MGSGLSEHGVTIAVAVIAGVLGASGIVNVIIAYIIKPHMFAEVIQNHLTDPHVVMINVKNTGNAPAKDLDLTVTTSTNITNRTTIFSTENYSKIPTTTPQILHLHIPRFVEGEGSLVGIQMLTDPLPNSTSPESYDIYTTYDVGSSKLVTTVTAQPPYVIVEKQTTNDYDIYLYGAVSIVISVVIVVVYIILRKQREKLKKFREKLKSR
jgi:hypothetical protein